MPILGNDLLKHGDGVGPPALMTIVSGSGQSATCGSAYALPLVAIVVDVALHPVPGVSVTFTAPASGASGTFASTGTRTETVVTGVDGKATSSTFTAGSPDSGAFNVAATAGALSVNFALTNLVLYLLRDEFTTTEAAPMVTPRNCEPGPGQLTLTDGSNRLSIASSKLTWGDAASAFTDPRVVGPSTVRTAGRVLLGQFNLSKEMVIGWANGATGGLNGNIRAFYVNGTALQALFIGGNQIGVGTVSTGTDYAVANVLQSGGAGLFIKGGAFSGWSLVWASQEGTTTPVFPVIEIAGTTVTTRTNEYLRMRDLPAAFATLEMLSVASPASGTSYTGVADGTFELQVTAPTPLANSAELRFRVQDATNYWTAYFAADGSFNVDSVVSGTPTNRITAAAVIAAGQTRTIHARAVGTLLDTYTLSGTSWTKRGAQVNQNILVTQTTVVPVLTGAWTMANLKAWNYTTTAWETELSKT